MTSWAIWYVIALLWGRHHLCFINKIGTFWSNYSKSNKNMADNSSEIPTRLKTDIEKLSGFDMSDVKVIYNSDKPAQLNAHAYAQGNQIHLGPGQERHLPHLAWHVVQQKQGRVKPSVQMNVGGESVDAGLEKEAYSMARKLSE
jgi:hypothetical protein